ncbi:hypothetical protein MATL_G00255600 [Megalops atlanticus]|uniref:Uncharacterized protein n=1 Tax=Megalops atlanticus TaxID=7932 RepID=A0A9D3PEA7_MEGAT|nr:hypothetical protein MATL_G00255600 [Megalops atlanticus]
MSNCVALRSQLASIMEVLANAAVAEICKLVEDSYAVLRSEMSRSQKENEALKRTLSIQMLELKIAKEGHFQTEDRAFHSQTISWRDGELTALEEEDTTVQSVTREQELKIWVGMVGKGFILQTPRLPLLKTQRSSLNSTRPDTVFGKTVD